MRKGFFIGLCIFLLIIVVGGYIFLQGYNELAYNKGKYTQIQNLRASFCGALGGEMREAASGIASSFTKCEFPYRGGGKACQSSKDCSGLCIVTSPNFNGVMPEELKKCKQGENGMFDCSGQIFQAQCQQWPLENCENVLEYDHGIVKEVFSKNCSIGFFGDLLSRY